MLFGRIAKCVPPYPYRFKNRPPKICPKCCLAVCSDTCCDGRVHSDDCQTLSKLLVRRNTDVEKRFHELAPCIGVIRLIRLKKVEGHPVNQLISARDESFPLSGWEKRIVETLASSNSAEGWLTSFYLALALPAVSN